MSSATRSRRAEAWLAGLARERPASRDELEALIEERGLPRLAAALELEEQLGGLRTGDLRIGPLGLLQQMPAASSRPWRALPEGAPALIAASSEAGDIAFFVDGSGHVYATDGGPLMLAADSAGLWIEKLALEGTSLATPRAVTLEVLAAVGEALVHEMKLAPVLEATDSASSWWKGNDLVAYVPASGMPVRLLCASIRAALEAFEAIAAPGVAIPVRITASRTPPPTPMGKGPKIPDEGVLPFAARVDDESGAVFPGRVAGRPTLEQLRTRRGLTIWETFSDGGHARREGR